MLQSLKKACSWVVSQVEAGIDWVRDNWPAIKAKTEEMVQQVYVVAMPRFVKPWWPSNGVR